MKPAMMLMLPGLALAQEFIDQAGGLSSKEAVEIALRRNSAIGVVRGAVAVAEGQLAEAGVPNNPGIQVGMTDFANAFDLSSTQRKTVGMSWSPPRIGELGLRRGIAKSKVGQTEGELRVARTQLAAEVRVLHRTIRLLDDRIRLAESVELLRDRILGVTREQVAAGLKTALDLGAVELTVAEERSLAVQLRLERQVQMNRLLAKMNLPASAKMTLRPDEDENDNQVLPLDRAKLTAQALAGRAEVEVAQARCAQAESALRLKNSERYPWFSSVQASRRTGRAGDPGFWVAQASIELPIFRWRDSYLKSSKAALERCGADRDVAQANIEAEVEELVSLLESRYRELENIRETLAPLAERHLAQVKSAVEAGRADAVELLTAEVRQLGLRQELLAKTIEVRRLEFGLQQAVGSGLD